MTLRFTSATSSSLSAGQIQNTRSVGVPSGGAGQFLWQTVFTSKFIFVSKTYSQHMFPRISDFLAGCKSRGITLRAFCGCTLLCILAAYRCFQIWNSCPMNRFDDKDSLGCFCWVLTGSLRHVTLHVQNWSSVGKLLYDNALTESERLNDSEYRSPALKLSL